MHCAFLSLQQSESVALVRKTLLRLFILTLLVCPALAQAADEFESRTWTDRKGNQLTSTFVDAKNGEVQFKNDEGQITKFKLADFSEPDQKYLRDLANYRRKQAAGEKPELPADPAKASLEIQARQTNTEPVPDMIPFRKPLLDFPIRTWTDSTGKKVQGKLVTAYNDKVVIDVKGNVFDLPITKFSPDDQQYVATQLKGLQRDDLVTVLAKAATAGQQQPGAAPPPATVAANTPPAPLEANDIKARLEQLKAQREANNPNAGTQVAANTPPAQPLGTNDIKARLAQIRQQKGEPEPEHIPSALTPGISSASQLQQEQSNRLEQQRQEAAARMNQMAADAQARRDELNRKMQETNAQMHRPPTGTAAPPNNQTQVMVKQCSKCGRVVPDSTGVGDRCPGCGIYFNYDETDVAGSVGYRIGQGVGVLIMISLVVAGVKKLFG